MPAPLPRSTERADDLRAALTRIRAHKEWGSRPTPPGRPGPALLAIRIRRRGIPAGGRRAGAAYLARRRQELSAHERARRDVAASAEQIQARLAALADEGRLHPPQSPQLAGHSAQMILNAAYLVADEREGDFAAAVADLAGAEPGGADRDHRPVAAVLLRRPAGTGPAMSVPDRALPAERVALVDLLDRVLARGVVITGDVTLSIADVDLVTVSLRALITSVGALAEPRPGA